MPLSDNNQLTINDIARIGSNRRSRFDPWNSSSTGHQVAETRPGTGWRESRTTKLGSQLKSGSGGGVRMQDMYGQGAADYDEKLNMIVPREVRIRAQTTVADMIAKPGVMRKTLEPETAPRPGTGRLANDVLGLGPQPSRGVPEAHPNQREDASKPAPGQQDASTAAAAKKGKFSGLVVYINGSMQPAISDLKLKRIFAEQGATVSLHLARRQVTHVILGRNATVGRGAGGGLAGSKINKEIHKVGGNSVKYVNVEWVLESLKAGKRLSEARFSSVKVAHQGQKSVFSMFPKLT
ncbi:hypothetical protein CFO_g5355 [Ceratocystis platani]|uniref:BRCT domain-containing protein n=1 Tax=Ceratocystis fimbriata f. sp. platani TaxID=88771 RepID=A0A0F8CNJ6_CERFI|nr:hypothetical protein CFO_g5355 [Ceratocystis platani]